MVMNWEVIMWSCVTVIVLLGIFAIILTFISARNMRKNRQAMQELQNKIQIGARVLFGGGIYGKIVRIKDDVIDVEMAKGLVVQISRYGIQDVVSE
ncbi:preprotein translocase subunit YajC [Lachnoclostridium sp. An131]|nr:preprotein translocase subunit YajC [Lachnoclostridium sp. An131]